MQTEAETLLDLMQQEQVTLSAGVPAAWMGILHSLEREPQRWKLAPGMRALVSGAAPPPEMIRQLDKHGIHVIQAWGLVESGPLATFATLTPALEKQAEEKQNEARATQGRPLPFVELRAVADSEDSPRDGSSLGEAQLRGPWVASSYYRIPELRGKWTEDGWFRTGDVVSIAPDGYMKIADRARDLIRFGDDWISSVDLENALMGHPAVKEAAVIAVHHPKLQERPLAAIVLKPGAQASAEQLRLFLSDKFAVWQIPDAFVFVPELPHTPTGKLLKKELRSRFRDWKWTEPELASGDASKKAS
jgi:fatty-acyl-CoA synthase